MYRFAALLMWILFLPPLVVAETVLTGVSEGMEYRVEEVADGQGVIWSMEFLGDEELLFTERQGKVKILDLASGRITQLSGVAAVWDRGQGGLLDAAVPSDYSAGDWVYFTYSKEVDGQGATTLARARLRKRALVDWQDMLVTRSATETGRHFGSRIVFDGRGHLYFSVGDRGHRPNGQDLSTHAGSILRLNMDGTVPKDNPIVGKEGLPEIWSYGHRNPQGLFWDAADGELWSNEHGPRGGDEIQIIRAGENYGWPVVSHGKEYWGPVAVGDSLSRPGMADPLKVYIPSIAPSSLLMYKGEAFGQWRGDLFSGALAMVHLNRVTIDAQNRPVDEERLLLDLDERIRDVIESPEGWVYVSTDSGRILRIMPAVDAAE